MSSGSVRNAMAVRRAAQMTDAEIAAELSKLGAEWDAFASSDDEGHGGSPGEWMIERMGELETERSKRADRKIVRRIS